MRTFTLKKKKKKQSAQKGRKYNGINDFAEVAKNLNKCRSENNFVESSYIIKYDERRCEKF